MTENVITRTATVGNVFVGEGYFDLSLKIGQLEDLQDLTGAGPAELANRFLADTWRIKDLEHTMRLALIGGGMDGQRAFDIVERHVKKEGYLLLYVKVALIVLRVALLGPEEDPVGESQAATAGVEADGSNGHPSTASAAPQATRRKKSAK